ncbi:VOC family protein [Streptomyces albofaciens JCM 4342]|uniref:VOC family protein n=1 Tax=Streptomyces albofaciens TaxID=66866 RepID=UPI0012396A3F|nr:VOC family protein [Streptomyces albofaciens]KAA6213185.1 VOC family protein [Streptomyces albofaciens JCM 4342]
MTTAQPTRTPGLRPTEAPRFDHLLHCVPDVAAAVREYTAAGLPAHTNPVHEGFQNGAWRLDDRYVEILTVVDRAAYAPSPFGRATAGWQPRIDALVAAGGGPLNFAVHVTDTAATAERLRRAGHRVDLHDFSFQEGRVTFREAMLTDDDTPPWAPFFITCRIDPALRREHEASGRINRGAFDLAGFLVETPDPRGAAAWLGTLIGVPLDAGGTVVPLDGGAVHFTAGPADRITTLLLTGDRPPRTEIAGLRVRGVADV